MVITYANDYNFKKYQSVNNLLVWLMCVEDQILAENQDNSIHN